MFSSLKHVFTNLLCRADAVLRMAYFERAQIRIISWLFILEIQSLRTDLAWGRYTNHGVFLAIWPFPFINETEHINCFISSFFFLFYSLLHEYFRKKKGVGPIIFEQSFTHGANHTRYGQGAFDMLK